MMMVAGRTDDLPSDTADLRQQLDCLLAITRALAESDLFEQAEPEILSAIREAFDAEACELWLVDDDGALRMRRADSAGGEALRRFAEEGSSMVLAPGEGLPGLVWLAQQPQWVEDIASGVDVARKSTAAAAGLRSAAAFPILVGAECFGVIGVYLGDARPLDETAAALMAAIGQQLGYAVRRERVEAEQLGSPRGEQHKRAEETTAHLAAIVDNTDAAIIGKTLDGTVTSWNQGAERIYGYRADEMVGQSIARIIPEDRADELHDILDRLRRGEPIRHHETVRHRKDGRLIDISLAISPIRDASGQIIGASAIGHDVTQLNLARGALYESEERLRFTLRSAGVGSWDWNIKTGKVTWSDNLEAVHGQAPGTFGGTFEDVMSGGYPPDVPRVREAIDTALASGGSFEVEYRFVRGDGSLGWLHGQGRAILDHAGRPIRMAGVCMDVTRRRRADETARLLAEAGVILTSTLDYESTLEAIAQILVPSLGDWCAIELLGEQHDIEHVTVIHADPDKVDLALELRSKYPPRMDASQPGFARAIHTGKAELFAEMTDELVRESAYDEEHYEILRKLGMKSGLVVPLIARGRMLGAITLVSAESGRRYGEYDVGLVRELALRCALAVDNARLYQNAQREIAERRRAEQQLREAREVAETANRSKSEFLTNMSHEIRTPMTAILGYADLLGRSLRDPDDLANLDIIRRNGRFLLDILNDILDLSRIEAGKLAIERQRFRPHDLFSEVHNLMEIRAREKQLAFSLEFDGPIPETIESDPTRLRQIAVNLVGNAIKFTESGSVRVVVRHAPGSATLSFDVIDTGIGIAPAQIRRLFQPFAQADASVARRYGGSGVGLALSQRLAEMLDGRIEVQSAPNKGTTFTVHVATGTLEGVPIVDPHRSSPTEERVRPVAGPQLDCHVLIVDDQPELRYFVEQVIIEAGGETVSAADGREALALVQQAEQAGRPVDVVLMDMRLPEMDGYETTSRLRAGGFTAPIIAMTAFAMPQDRERCLEVGCDDYISKPIDLGELVDVVRRNSRKSAGGRQAPDEGQAPAAGTEAEEPVRILLVEDSRTVCRMMCLLLGSRGYDVRPAHSGAMAISAAREFCPDVVVLDLGLPDMSGYDVAERLRVMPELEHSVLIALSGRGGAEVRRRSEEAGFHHQLVKPADVDELEALFPRRGAPQHVEH